MAAKSVTCTNVNQEKASRYDIVKWVNSFVGTKYTKIEQLATGAAYCRLLDILWPGTIPVKRIKMETIQEHEFIENFKIVQAAFTKHGINAWMPIERLVKARFQDNYEFAQWFKMFFDANYSGQGISAIESPPEEQVVVAAPERNSAQKARPPRQQAAPRGNTQPSRSSPKATDVGIAYGANPSSNGGSAHHRIRELESRIAEQDSSLEEVEHLRQFYFTKLRLVEILAQQCADNGEKNIDAQRILEILYAESHPEAADLD